MELFALEYDWRAVADQARLNGRDDWADAFLGIDVIPGAQRRGMTSRHVDDVSIVGDTELLLEVADSADQHDMPRLLKLLSVRRARRHDFQLLITVFPTIFAGVASRNALGAFARDLGQLSPPSSHGGTSSVAGEPGEARDLNAGRAAGG